jgi:hypothetical protein
VRPSQGREPYRSLRRPLLKRKTGPAGTPCASESVASARCSRLGCLCSLGAGVDGRRTSSTKATPFRAPKRRSFASRFARPSYGVCGKQPGLSRLTRPNPNSVPHARNTLSLAPAATVCQPMGTLRCDWFRRRGAASGGVRAALSLGWAEAILGAVGPGVAGGVQRTGSETRRAPLGRLHV